MITDGEIERQLEISSEYSILDLKNKIAKAYDKVFNANLDNFIIELKD
jgi:hypothetical protein